MRLPSWLQWYKKPSYRDITEYANAVRDGKRDISPGRGSLNVPNRLSLERILKNETCSPMSLYDFYMYLRFIELSPENLEFYVWFKHYQSNYGKSSSANLFAVGPDLDDKDSQTSGSTSSQVDLHKQGMTDVYEQSADAEDSNDTLTYIIALINPISSCSPSAKPSQPFGTFVRSVANSCGLGPRPSAPIPASSLAPHDELANVATLFLLPGAPKELNIPPAMRTAALSAMEHSTSPEHLQPIADHCYQLLKHCSHRNFIRLGVSNGTFETLCVATTLGIVLLLAGFLLVFLRAFYPARGAHSRWEAFAAWPLWWLGAGLVISGLRGSCFFLLLFSRRQPLPWERFGEEESEMLRPRWAVTRMLRKLMIFDRKVRVKDATLRDLQRKIVLQSLLGGAVLASALTAVWVFVPVWRGM